jgi:hypothetical protein
MSFSMRVPACAQSKLAAVAIGAAATSATRAAVRNGLTLVCCILLVMSHLPRVA